MTRRIRMANGSPIYRSPGESLVQAAKRIQTAILPHENLMTLQEDVTQYYTSSVHQYQDSSESEDSSASGYKTDNTPIYIHNVPQTNDEELQPLYEAYPADKTSKMSTAARKNIKNNIYPSSRPPWQDKTTSRGTPYEQGLQTRS